MKQPRTDAHVGIRTAVPHGVPLSKERIAIYNSGLVPIERYDRDRDLIARVGAESLRIDLGWGAEWIPRQREVVRKHPDGSLEFDFEETDEIARLISTTGSRPYWSYCYVPAAARRPEQSWMGMAEDDSVWVETVRAYVETMAERGVAIGYHEVYNEPDLRDERTGAPHFYEGDLDDYLDLYRATSRAIRAADPSARVGGPSLAVTSINARWLERFLEMVEREQLPLDFLSFHHYGHFSVESTIRIVREVLDGFDGFADLELHLNEYNSFVIDYPRGGLQDTHFLASSFAAEIPRLLGHRDLTRTHWAQFMDSGQGNFSGMIDIDGVPKPIYDVYEFYQGMPLRQVAIDLDGPEGVGAIASSDGATTRAIVWNRSALPVDVAVELDHLDRPDSEGSVTVLDGSGRSAATVSGGDTAVRLDAGAVALIHFGAPVGQRGARRCVALLPRPTGNDDGWLDVDEAGASIHLQGGALSVTREVAIDTTDAELASSDWDVVVDGADSPNFAVSLHIESDSGTVARTLRGASTHAPSPRSRPRPAGSTRLTFVLEGVAPWSRVDILPRAAAR